MEKASQSKNIIQIETPLGKDVLHLTQFDIQEGISAPFLINVSCYTNGQVIAEEDVIGKPVTINLDYLKGKSTVTRFFNGVVASVTSLGSRVPSEADGEKFQDYQLQIVSHLHFLKQRTNCRIFQNLSADEIVKKVLAEHGVQVKSELKTSYPTLGFKVQYNESDFAFVHRLLEEVGIFYFIEHTKANHSVVLADALSAYREADESKVAFTTGSLSESHVFSWSGNLNITPGRVSKGGFDFVKPSAKPKGEHQNTALAKQQKSAEVFEYYAGSEFNPQLQTSANVALEAMQRDALICSGGSTCATFTAGQYFSFKSHEDPAQVNKTYLITQLSLSVAIASQTGAAKNSGQVLHNQFSCIPSDVLFRPSQATARPVIHGAQTALVTGDPGEEIHVDKYGRIKVLFHWDREGKSDGNSSCWIRVSQSWAGSRYGAFFLPRVGQEVLVSFLEGDPDQPVITGALYNGDQMPPYGLPSKKSQSGIKTRSTKGGGDSNFNEIRFDDDTGKELLYMQAEKDLQTEIKQNQSEKIGKDLSVEVAENQSEKVGKNLVIDVGKNIDLVAGSNITIKAGGASITLSSGGSIDIKGTSISINGTSIALKAPAISLN
ncbi:MULTISPECIES: type VI secretion system Vgr family protein [unclassified Agarivorans]|uniref:type VI secretion system Vgr family protein n=1 Tax=unclassified Agarivorans TaxID=2636026 RepID=UPI0026E35BAA|nr:MULTISPECIES: type VI secretion system tip protein TssI/VgrG [unclassified Agarivorans]MDO6685492.1 type VI secretion system tip protein TssI/VgrG [Agarivorans sp. 3_MG-2023]MDO6715878.1 type VI secretion system tip protein TssI/VgrG [Agarivorans sp. 2_MG-2023]MDO6764921.1 type VI secretion system tip protein TssI/VgrG [Agarivorans sp. 1_MG-2023]